MSFLLDTNVVSELIRKSPDPAVETWAAGHALEDLFFSAVGEAELRYGAAILPAGRRRDALVRDIGAMLRDAFEDRVLPFDSAAVRAYAEIAAVRRAAGRPIAPAGHAPGFADIAIAATAANSNLVVLTRNLRHFGPLQVPAHDPYRSLPQPHDNE